MFRRLVRIFRHALLILAGFILGVILFAPWPSIWTMALDKAYQYLPAGVEVGWGAIPEAGPNWLTFSKLEIRSKMLKKPLVLDRATIRLGFTPLVSVTVNTGRDLNVKFYKNMRIYVTGGVGLEPLPLPQAVSGFVAINGDLLLNKDNFTPTSGMMELTSEGINIPGLMEAKTLRASLVLNDNQLDIQNFSCEYPFPAKGKGQVRLNYRDLPDSSFRVQGQATIAGEIKTFKRSGRLSEAAQGL